MLGSVAGVRGQWVGGHRRDQLITTANDDLRRNLQLVGQTLLHGLGHLGGRVVAAENRVAAVEVGADVLITQSAQHVP